MRRGNLPGFPFLTGVPAIRLLVVFVLLGSSVRASAGSLYDYWGDKGDLYTVVAGLVTAGAVMALPGFCKWVVKVVGRFFG